MSYHLVSVDPGNFNIEENFWEVNPQLKYYPVFKDLYQSDRGKGKIHSSKVMWCVWMLHDPRKNNTVYRQPPDIQKQIIGAYYAKYYKVDENEREALGNAFRRYCLTPAKRAFISAEQTLEKRARFLDGVEYTMEGPLYNEDGTIICDNRGNPVIVKSNVRDIDTMHKNTLSIVEQYDKARSFFEDDEESASRMRGGRAKTLRERGGLIMDIEDKYEEE